MKRCARCNKKRGVLDRIFGLDKEFCDDCLMVVTSEEQNAGIRMLKYYLASDHQ